MMRGNTYIFSTWLIEFVQSHCMYQRGDVMHKSISCCLCGIFLFCSLAICQEEVKESSVVRQAESDGGGYINPYSKGIGPQVVGWILAGDGLVSLVLGLTLDVNNTLSNSYAEAGERDLGETLEKITWIEGAVQIAIGIPFIISGSVQHGKWKKWEIEHGNLKVSLRGTKIIVDF
jgi:hypothetical protein